MKKYKIFLNMKKLISTAIVLMMLFSVFSIINNVKTSKAGEDPPGIPDIPGGPGINPIPFPDEIVRMGDSITIDLPSLSDDYIGWSPRVNPIGSLSVYIDENGDAVVSNPYGYVGEVEVSFRTSDSKKNLLWVTGSCWGINEGNVFDVNVKFETYPFDIAGKHISVASLDDSHYVVAYQRIDGTPLDTDICVRVGIKNEGGSIDFGNRYTVEEARDDMYWPCGPRVTALSDNRFVVAYGGKETRQWGYGYIFCKVGTITSDGGISFGPELQWKVFTFASLRQWEFGDLCTLDDSHFVLSWTAHEKFTWNTSGIKHDRPTHPSHYCANVYEIIGDTIDINGYVWRRTHEFNTAPFDPVDYPAYEPPRLTVLDSTHFIFAFKDQEEGHFYQYNPLRVSLYEVNYRHKMLMYKNEYHFHYTEPYELSALTTLDSSHFVIGHGESAQIGSIINGKISFGGLNSVDSSDEFQGLYTTNLGMILNNGILELGKVNDNNINVVEEKQYSSMDADQVDADNVDTYGVVIAHETDKIGYISYIQTNNLPSAIDDSSSMNANTFANQIDVLDNDFDVDDDTLSVSDVGVASHGSVTFDDSFVYYTPDTSFVGSDSFTYNIIDDNGGTDSALVTIEINQVNNAPDKPNTPNGEDLGKTDTEYSYTSSATDSEEDQIWYLFDWGDDTDSGWIGPYNSGANCEASHKWDESGSYSIKVKAKDSNGDESDWSETITVNIEKSNVPKLRLILIKFFENHPRMFPILRALLGL